ncbi:pseudouridine synthase family protein [Actinidia rufa]|uniref:tRNA pseudouridine(55) synthase n=1 Tax=Actinidia rufa TaxID=165716 RepID=A0A7J0FC69_9ERIC|nr:pseudouridine synthase family protein [Actinidia rufa]
MANDTEAAAQGINGQVETHVISSAEDEAKLVHDAVRALPSHAVKELLSRGVCIWCIFRLIGVTECIYSCTLLSTSALFTALEKGMCLEGDMVDNGLWTRWVIDDERMEEVSVEVLPNASATEIIGSNILPIFHGDNYKFHATGREDIDVRMLAFEIQNAHHVPSLVSIKEIERKVNNLENKMSSGSGKSWVQSLPLQLSVLVYFVKRVFVNIVRVKNTNQQKTALEREKIIHWVRIERIAGSSQYFLPHLCTQHWFAFLDADQRYCNLMSQMRKWIVSNSTRLLWVLCVTFDDRSLGRLLPIRMRRCKNRLSMRRCWEIWERSVRCNLAKCLTGKPRIVEKSQMVFMLWVELEAVDVFLSEKVEKFYAKSMHLGSHEAHQSRYGNVN